MIVTSNLSQTEDKNRARNLGAKGYLVKSDTTIGDIGLMVKKYLNI